LVDLPGQAGFDNYGLYLQPAYGEEKDMVVRGGYDFNILVD